MKLFTSKNLSSSLSVILHVIIFILLLFSFNQNNKINNKQQYVVVGFGGVTETNSPGSPGGGNDVVKPQPKKEKTKVKEREKPKPKEEDISKDNKKEKKVKTAANSDSSKGTSPGKLAENTESGTGSGSGSGGNGNGQPGSGSPKKGLYIPKDIYYVAVDQMPVPVGGMEALNARVFYPPSAKANHIQGTVYVQAFIDESGNVKKVSLIKGIGYGCDQAAERAVKDTRFQPGAMHGVPVKVRLTIPVEFGSDN